MIEPGLYSILEWFSMFANQCIPWPVASALSGILLEMQILRPYPRPTESETLGLGSSHLCFNKTSKWLWCMLKFENYCSKEYFFISNYILVKILGRKFISNFWKNFKNKFACSLCGIYIFLLPLGVGQARGHHGRSENPAFSSKL